MKMTTYPENEMCSELSCTEHVLKYCSSGVTGFVLVKTLIPCIFTVVGGTAGQIHCLAEATPVSCLKSCLICSFPEIPNFTEHFSIFLNLEFALDCSKNKEKVLYFNWDPVEMYQYGILYRVAEKICNFCVVCIFWVLPIETKTLR